MKTKLLILLFFLAPLLTPMTGSAGPWGQIVAIDNTVFVAMVDTSIEDCICIQEKENWCWAACIHWLSENAEEDNYVFPGFTRGDLDMKLRSWAKAAGIRKKVTFHVARRTFATLLITSGTDIYTVSKLLGHSSVKHTQIYARMVDSVKDAAADAIDNIQWK